MTTSQMKKMAQQIFEDYHRDINYQFIENGDAEYGIKEQDFILKNKDQIINLIQYELASIKNWKQVKSVKLVKEFDKYRVDIENIKKEK